MTTRRGSEPIVEVTTSAAPTVALARRDRRTIGVAATAFVFLAAAILKPWASGAEPAPTALDPAGGAAAVAAGPTDPITPPADPAAGAKDGIRPHCQDPLGWRVYSRELWSGTPVRVWRRLEPAAAASGPDDPSIPTVEVGPEVTALGYCSPWSVAEAPPAGSVVSAWRLEPGATAPVPVAEIQPLTVVAPTQPNVLGSLFDPAGAPHDWPVGRFVFAIRAGDWGRWWAVVVLPEHVAAR